MIFITDPVLQQGALDDIKDLREKIHALNPIDESIRILDNTAYHLVIMFYGRIEYIRTKFKLEDKVDASGRPIENKTNIEVIT